MLVIEYSCSLSSERSNGHHLGMNALLSHDIEHCLLCINKNNFWGDIPCLKSSSSAWRELYKKLGGGIFIRTKQAKMGNTSEYR